MFPGSTPSFATWFDSDYEVQTMNVSSTTVLQARKSSTLRDLTGLSAALTNYLRRVASV